MSDIQTDTPKEEGVFASIKNTLLSAYDWAMSNDDESAVASKTPEISLGSGMAEGARQQISGRQAQIDRAVKCALDPKTPGC